MAEYHFDGLPVENRDGQSCGGDFFGVFGHFVLEYSAHGGLLSSSQVGELISEVIWFVFPLYHCSGMPRRVFFGRNSRRGGCS